MITKETYTADQPRTRELLVAALAVIYTPFLVFAAGPKFLPLFCIIYAPGTVLYVIARRESAQRMFRPFELALCVLIIIGAVIGVVLLATGAITI